MYTIPYNTWIRLEVEVLLNTPGVSDGTIRVYAGNNSIPVYENTSLAVRNIQTTPIKYITIGAQVDRPNAQVVDEYRYWDNITIDNQYITP